MNDNPEILEAPDVEAPPTKKRGRPRKVVVEAAPEILTEVPPVEEVELLTEVPPVESSEEVLFETPVWPPAPSTPIVGPTPPDVDAEEKPHNSPHYSAAQIKKLRSAYSRRTLLTRFGISW